MDLYPYSNPGSVRLVYKLNEYGYRGIAVRHPKT